MFKPSIKYEVVLGLIEGYELKDIADLDFNVDAALIKWKEYALEYFKLTDVYVSAVATKSDVLYNEDWGCPKYGEPVIKFECTMNPEFIKDEDVYEEGVVYITKKLQEYFNQSTVTITKLPAGICYLKKEN